MLRIIFVLSMVFLLHKTNYAQQSIDAKALAITEASCVSVSALSSYIKENFSTDTDRIRAIYVWITHHISYDVAMFLARDENVNKPNATAEEILSKRTGVCRGYTDLFVALCKGAGINAVVVGGYTKRQTVVASVSHAWVVAELGGKWQLFDPTWGSGHVRNERFIKRFNNEFYNPQPAKFLETHMPFDPIYQLIPYPISNHEFIDSRPAANKTLINYADSIKAHQQLSKTLQASAELRRLEAAGFHHTLLQERRTYLKNIIQSSSSKSSFDEGLVLHKSAIKSYNEFLAFRNKQFADITDADLKQRIDSIEFYIKKSRELISETVPKTDAQWQAKTRQIASIDKLWVAFINQKDFTTKYIATEKEKRKFLFMRQ